MNTRNSYYKCRFWEINKLVYLTLQKIGERDILTYVLSPKINDESIYEKSLVSRLDEALVIFFVKRQEEKVTEKIFFVPLE